MHREEVFILTDPACPETPLPPGAVPVHPVFRVGDGMQLLLHRGHERVQGGIAMVSAPASPSGGSPETLCAQLLFACAARRFRGVFLNFEATSPQLSTAAVMLGKELSRRELSLLLPEVYAPLVPTARPVLSCAISGGSLERRLRDAMERFGPRIILALESTAEDFPLPAPDGRGIPLSPRELSALRRGRCVHFSPALCGRYFLHREGGHPRLVLFDDGDTLNKKLALARTAGFRAFLLPAETVRESVLFHAENFSEKFSKKA